MLLDCHFYDVTEIYPVISYILNAKQLKIRAYKSKILDAKKKKNIKISPNSSLNMIVNEFELYCIATRKKKAIH